MLFVLKKTWKYIYLQTDAILFLKLVIRTFFKLIHLEKKLDIRIHPKCNYRKIEYFQIQLDVTQIVCLIELHSQHNKFIALYQLYNLPIYNTTGFCYACRTG